MVHVAVHSSQFPNAVRAEFLRSLRERAFNHRFHYESVKQAAQWVAVHEAYSPAVRDPGCAAIYEASYQAIQRELAGRSDTDLISLGCGNGHKDAALIRLLYQRGRLLRYFPSDVSLAMVLMARAAVLAAVPSLECAPVLCDLELAEDLPGWIQELARAQTRVVTFFGMVPNFAPATITARLSPLIRPGDFLLLSANLAPGPDYALGVGSVLPQYDNALTKRWLETVLRDSGVDEDEGEVEFRVEDCPHGSGLKRIAAYFKFGRACRLQACGESFEFEAGASLRLFFSYRHTSDQVAQLLQEQGIQLVRHWTTDSGEEGVFLGQRQ